MKIANQQNFKAILKACITVLFFGALPILSISVLLLVCFVNSDAWYSELLAFTIPPIMLFALLSLILYIKIKPGIKYLIVLIMLGLLCIKPLIETVAFRFKEDKGVADFKVMSYNVAAFNPVRMVDLKSDIENYKELYNWFRDNESPDILCLQEFYHGDEDEYDLTLDSIALLGEYKYYYINPRYNEDTDGMYGVITFSKYRAINAGQILYGDTLVNKGIFNDFIIKNDTVRIVNFQLKSMSIRWSNNEEYSFARNVKHNVADIVKKLVAGNETRRNEVAVIDSFLTASTFKTVLCADINAVPYSATYQKLNKNYYNSFEKGGTGFGFTYNRFPSVIRIDNQFFDKRMKIDYFKTRSDMKFSDHYPVEAGYSFK